MSLIALVGISHEDLALTPTIVDGPPSSIQVVPQSSTDPETNKFFFLVEDVADFEAFEAALDADHTVAEWDAVSDFDGGRLYRLGHTEETKLISPKTVELGGLMLEATSKSQGWNVRLQFPNRETLSELWEFCDAEGIGFDLRQVYHKESAGIGDATGLTDAQRETLVKAHEAGYFEEPRRTSLAELAEELELSPTAVGGRIRRGTAALVETTLIGE